MAKKKLQKIIKLQIPAGKASPAPPIGPALGGAQVNIMEFCKKFNADTQKDAGKIFPVEISVYTDKSFTIKYKEPPMAELLKKATGITKGSGVPNRDKVAKLTRAQAEQIAQEKMPDLNARDMDAAVNIVAGTARSMGIDFVTE